jgi:hypothetical protein
LRRVTSKTGRARYAEPLDRIENALLQARSTAAGLIPHLRAAKFTHDSMLLVLFPEVANTPIFTPVDSEALAERPVSLVDHLWTIADSRPKGGQLELFIHVLAELHPQHIGWSNRLQLLDEFLSELRGYPNLWNPTASNARAIGWKLTRPTRICASNRASGRTIPAASAKGLRMRQGVRCRGRRSRLDMLPVKAGLSILPRIGRRTRLPAARKHRLPPIVRPSRG